MKESWFIIADDFTGAGDSAVQFSADHAPSRLIVSIDGAARHVSGHAAIVVDTDSRYLAEGTAFEPVRKVAAELTAAGAKRFFKKIDSTLRGNIAEEVDAVMQGAGLSAALVCSAAPRNGRTIIDGLCLVGGLPVGSGQTVKDRFTPVLDASVARHFESRFPGASARLPLDMVRSPGPRLVAEVEKLMLRGVRIFIADAETMDDLGALAVLSEVPGLLMVGSSGLAQALADRENTLQALGSHADSGAFVERLDPSEMLFLVGSITPTSIAQCEVLAAEGSFRRIMIDTEAALANPDKAVADLSMELSNVPGELGILLQADTMVPSLTAEAAKIRGKAVSNICARLALIAMKARNLRFAFASGGDTAAKVAAVLGAQYIDFTKELLPGLPFGSFHSATLDRPLFFASKSGGFGGSQTLVELKNLLATASSVPSTRWCGEENPVNEMDRTALPPVVGVTMGDASGIGPEVILMALRRPELRDAGRFVVYGSPEAMERAARVVGWKTGIIEIGDPRAHDYSSAALPVVRCGSQPLFAMPFGALSADSGQLAFDSIRRAIEDALLGRIDATATAPLNKAALALAGVNFPGHTEIYAHFTNTEEYAMLLMEGNFRVVHISTHVSLFDAIKAVKKDRVVTVVKLVHEALVEMGISSPKIAVAGLNPHAGENGLFGREDIEEIAPAVAATTAFGAVGPLPPDSVFSRAAGGEFDAVVAMYHDQGHIPLKMMGFRYCEGDADGPSISGINVTLGSPVIRCSVDHGTAFDRAGKGTADPGSMATAMFTAAEMAAGALKRKE